MIHPAGANTVPKPCIAEFLHTLSQPSSLVLRVEHIFGKAQEGSHGNDVNGCPDEEKEGTIKDGDPDTEFHQQRSGGGEKEAARSSVRLVLSDTCLQIQALLSRTPQQRDEVQHLKAGDVIEVYKSEVRSSRRLNGQGRVVYLHIQDFTVVAAKREPKTAQATEEAHKAVHAVQEDLGTDKLEQGGGFLHEGIDGAMLPGKQPRGGQSQQSVNGEYSSWSKKKRNRKATHSQADISIPPPKKQVRARDSDDDSDNGGFETLAVSQSQVEQRRDTLRQIQTTQFLDEEAENLSKPTESQNLVKPQESLTLISPPAMDRSIQDGTDDSKPTNQETEKSSEASLTFPPIPMPASILPLPPPPQDTPLAPSVTSLPLPTPTLTTLSTLLSTPTPKSHPCPPLFAIISWISPSLIHSTASFPPKRHLKIHDPSISTRFSGLTVSVFIDAANFHPPIGTVALFRGLVMNSVRNGEDVILNRYPAKSGSQASGSEAMDGQEWFMGDEEKLTGMGFDVAGMRKWWEERSATKV